MSDDARDIDDRRVYNHDNPHPPDIPDKEYETEQEQVIQIGYWNGETLPPSSHSFIVKQKSIQIHFKISTAKEPKPPTPEEVAEATTAMLQQELVYYFDQITLLAEDFEANVITQWVLIVFVIVASLSALIIALMQVRRRY